MKRCNSDAWLWVDLVFSENQFNIIIFIVLRNKSSSMELVLLFNPSHAVIAIRSRGAFCWAHLRPCTFIINLYTINFFDYMVIYQLSKAAPFRFTLFNIIVFIFLLVGSTQHFWRKNCCRFQVGQFWREFIIHLSLSIAFLHTISTQLFQLNTHSFRKSWYTFLSLSYCLISYSSSFHLCFSLYRIHIRFILFVACVSFLLFAVLLSCVGDWKVCSNFWGVLFVELLFFKIVF